MLISFIQFWIPSTNYDLQGSAYDAMSSDSQKRGCI